MPEQAVPIAAAYSVRRRQLSVDEAVRAALSFHAPEPRTFRNEDDVEGGSLASAQMQQASPKD